MVSLTKSQALDCAPHDIRVNVTCPGFLWTRAWEGLAAQLRLSEPQFAKLTPREIFLEIVKRGVPMAREQTAEDIGHLAAFLASDAARNITGQWIAWMGASPCAWRRSAIARRQVSAVGQVTALEAFRAGTALSHDRSTLEGLLTA